MMMITHWLLMIITMIFSWVWLVQKYLKSSNTVGKPYCKCSLLFVECFYFIPLFCKLVINSDSNAIECIRLSIAAHFCQL